MHWRLSEASAMGFAGASQIEVFPSSPARAARWQAAPNAANLWEIAAVTPHPAHAGIPEEIYNRQSDLIVRYRQGPTDTFTYQLDWQLLPATAPFVAAVELWLSVQTDLLDTEPELEIVCSASGGQTWRAFEHSQLCDWDAKPKGQPAATRGPAALLCVANANADKPQASVAEPTSGLWLIEPTDQCNTRRCSDDDQATQRLRLFGHFMEKGVIRRGRMRFLLASGAVTTEHVQRAYRELADSPLPLTA